MRDTGLVGRAVVQRDARHERRLEPAAMLIGRFEIHVGRDRAVPDASRGPLRAKRRNRSRRRSCRCDGVVPSGSPSFARQLGVVHLEPDVRAAFLDEIGQLANPARHRESPCLPSNRRPAAARPRCAAARCTQSGRDSTVPEMRFSPQAGIQLTSSIAARAFARRSSMRMKNCSTARKMIGVFERQQCG